MSMRISRMEWRGAEVLAAEKAAKVVALTDAAERVLSNTEPRVPFREGELKGSGGTSVSDDEATVYYDTVYAARQHEETSWNHPRSGEAKYLENGLAASVDDVEAVLKDRLGRAVGG